MVALAVSKILIPSDEEKEFISASIGLFESPRLLLATLPDLQTLSKHFPSQGEKKGPPYWVLSGFEVVTFGRSTLFK